MRWAWGAHPRGWYDDHLDGRCGCDDERPRCETGVSLWRIARGSNVPLPLAGIDAIQTLDSVPRIFLN